VSLIVCDLLVVVTFIYLRFYKEDGDSDVTEPSEKRDGGSNGTYTDLGGVPMTTERTGLTPLTQITESRQMTSFSSTSDIPNGLGSTMGTIENGNRHSRY
jgi:hypothetical protein